MLFQKKSTTENQRKQIAEIVRNDFESLRKGTLSPENAYKLYTVFKIVYSLDEGATKKSIEDFYFQLKKNYPELSSFLSDK
jgi:hypothetical protein